LKYAVVILVVLLGVWLWRKNRADARDDNEDAPIKPHKTKQEDAPPQIMLSCAVCGVHLPKSDALVGKRGSYCSASHRQQQEG
jgi:uncharacterized protein